MGSRFCRCKDALTAACTAELPSKLQLLDALGLINPWLAGRQLITKALHSSVIRQGSCFRRKTALQDPAILSQTAALSTSRTLQLAGSCRNINRNIAELSSNSSWLVRPPSPYSSASVTGSRVRRTTAAFHSCSQPAESAAAVAAALPEAVAIPTASQPLITQTVDLHLEPAISSTSSSSSQQQSDGGNQQDRVEAAAQPSATTSSRSDGNGTSEASSSSGVSSNKRKRKGQTGAEQQQQRAGSAHSGSSASGSNSGTSSSDSNDVSSTSRSARDGPGGNNKNSRSSNSSARNVNGSRSNNSSRRVNGSTPGSGLSSKGSRTTTAATTSSSSSKIASSADVACKMHSLPPYEMNAEEQDSYNKATAVIRILSDHGFKAYIVGGWVRDKYLGRRASDIDIATNASPWELKRIFRHVIELPRSTVKVTHQGEVLEVTSFRGISRAANLFSVALDAELRDFTLNALYYDPTTKQVLDFVGGVPDAQARVLRLTADATARLSEDPLRALRCVRFAVVMGLKMTPETAQAVKNMAHMCSVQQGLPPRRIWLELRKLHRVEQQHPGNWCRSLKLCYHLGLLQHLFPWLEQRANSTTDPAKQAVVVAEKLTRIWTGRQQHRRQQGLRSQHYVPLSLYVAAMLHPACADRAQAYSQMEQYFPEASDIQPIDTLLAAADLTHGGSGSSPQQSDSAWVAVYASEHAQLCLDILAAWMPDVLADSFMHMHQSRMKQLSKRVAHQKQLLRAKVHHLEQQLPASAADLAPGLDLAAAADEPECVHLRQQRQQEELTAAIQALVGQ